MINCYEATRVWQFFSCTLMQMSDESSINHMFKLTRKFFKPNALFDSLFVIDVEYHPSYTAHYQI